MQRATIPAERLPRKAVSDFFESIQPILEILDYLSNEIFRVFFFIVDLLTLVASI